MKTNFTKIILIIILVTLLIIPTLALSAKKTTLRFWFVGTHAMWMEYAKEFIARYEAAHPDIKIEFEGIPHVDVDTKFNIGFAGNSGPDIISSALKHVAMYAERNQYAKLDDYIAKWENKDNMIDTLMKASLYKDGYTYALPYKPDPYLFLYRKDFARKAGLDPEKPPTSWEGFAEWAEKMTIRNGGLVTRSGFQISVNNLIVLASFAVQNGGSWFETPEAKFNEPQWVEALEYLVDMAKNKKVTTDSSVKTEWELSPFVSGKAAIAMANDSTLSLMFKNDPALKDQVGVLWPQRKRPCNWNGAWLLSLGEKSPNKDKAWDVMATWFGNEETWIRYKKIGTPPPLKSLADKFIDDNPFNAEMLKGVKYGIGNPVLSWAVPMNRAIMAAMEEAMYGKKTPEEALEFHHKRLLKEIELDK